jgi:hypothetical protein
MGLTNGVIEINDDINSTPKNVNGTVPTAGTPTTVTTPDGSKIQLALIKNPNKGPNANSANVVLLINVDDGLTSQSISLNRGEVYYLAGTFTTLKIDSTVNGAKFESVIWY